MASGKLRENGFRQQKLEKTRKRRESLAQRRDLKEAATHPRRNDLLPPLQVQMLRVGDLVPSPHRASVSSLEQVERLVRSIGEFGFTQPILTRGKVVIDGHIRLEAASELGLAQIPAIDCQHLSEVEARKLRLASNRLGQLSTWSIDLLKQEFESLIEIGEDLAVTGFSEQEQDIILLNDNPDEEEEIDPDQEDDGNPVSCLGDVWQLGQHRVVCGSALEEETYATLLGRLVVHAAVIDYPYNVKIPGNVSGLGKKKHKDFAMASGEMTREQFLDFLKRSTALVARNMVDGGALFGFMDFRSLDLLYQVSRFLELTIINLICWNKESGGMGANYRSAHELILLSCKGDQLRVNNIQLGRHGRDRTNVWVAPGANRRGSSANQMLSEHATPKPVELCVDAILDVTRRGEAVLDPFLGSGTTLIAAEKTGRVAYGIELEPRFVDVAIRRWQRLTGKEVVHVESGETFAQRLAARDELGSASKQHNEQGE